MSTAARRVPSHHRARAAAVSAVCAALAGLLAACGGSGGGAASPSGSRTAPGASPTAPAAPATSSASPTSIVVRSPAFAAGGRIPVRYTCRGANTPPPLTWSGVPAGAASVALVVDDPDAPNGTFTHWVVFNLPGGSSGITAGPLPAGAAEAQNGNGEAAYLGPCPPSGTHHYRFTVFAEGRRLGLRSGAGRREALAAIQANATASGRLIGLFGS